MALAQELDIEVPCIINGDAPGEELHTLDDVRSKFTDKTYNLRRCPRHGILSTPARLSHLGNYSMGENQQAVRKTVDQVLKRIDEMGY